MRTIILFFFSLFLAASVLSQNLVAYYPFNGNSNDQSGNGINSTYSGSGVTLTSDRFGNINSAYSFDGAPGSYMRMPADMLPTANRTISLWFNATTVTTRPYLLNYGGNGGPPGTSFLTGVNGIGCSCYHTQGHYYTNAVSFVYGAQPINQWIHWVVTINGSSTKMYVNGNRVADAPGSFTSNTYVTGRDLAIGVMVNSSGFAPYTDPNGGYFNGKMDDIRIYDNALTDAQVQNLYTSESMAAYYPFNSNANDASGNGNNGTVNGATLTTDRFGNANSSYLFNGNSDFISTANLATTASDNWTMTAWIKPSSLYQTGSIVCNGFDAGGGGVNGYSILMGDGGSGPGNKLTGLFSGVEWIDPGLPILVNNVWYHVAMVRNNGVTTIYLNAVPGAVTTPATPVVPSGSLRIGSQMGVRFFNGAIDEVKLFNKSFTTVQIQQLYNNESTDMIAYYPFNGNANDESGNNNHGTVNGATLTTDRFNSSNKAYTFNGSSNYINVPDAAILRTQMGITLSAWVKRTRFGIDIITEKGGDWTSGTCNYGMGLHNINNNMFYFFFNGGWRGTDGVNDFKWHQYTVVAKNGDNNPALYIDVAQKTAMYASGAAPISMNNSPLDLHIGAQVGGATYYGANIIDELKIYQRQLSTAEVQQMYNQSATGIVAYYPFNGNANDESGNSYNGTVSGATLTTDRFNQSGKAYNFSWNGFSSDKIQVPGTSALNFSSGGFTLSAWVKFSGTASAGYNYPIVSKHNCGEQSGYILMLYNDKITFWLAGAGGYSYISTTDNYTDGNWHHVAAVYNDNNRFIYVDGVLKISDVFAYTNGNNANLALGGYNGCNGGFNGKVDDISIYNRALSPNEIMQLADIPMMPDLVAYLPMNGNVNDMSGSNHNSTVVTATPATDKYENANTAYQFNGNGSGTSITLANTTTLDFLATPFALSAWVKFSTAAGEAKMIAGKHNCGFATGYFIGVDNNRLSYWLASGSSWSQVSTTETYNDGKWHLIIGSYNGVNQKLYVDGMLKAGTTTNYNTPATGAPIKVGEPNGCGGLGIFNGKIDEVKIYSSALDSAQAITLYKQSRGSGNAINFKGNNANYINIGLLDAPPEFSVEAWVKRNGSGPMQYIFSGTDNNSWGLGFSNNKLLIEKLGSDIVLSNPVNADDSKWHHIAFTFKNNNANFYFDGIWAGSGSISSTGTIASIYSVGNRSSSGNSFDGSIDELRVWGVELTQDVIRNWMNRKLTPAHPQYGYMGRYYNFDEANAMQVYDISNAVTGHLNGPVLIMSGAAIGDGSAIDFTNVTRSATLNLPTGENFTAVAGSGNPGGISVYVVKDAPNILTGTLGVGSNEHYYGVHMSGGINPQYTAVYDYTGDTLVTNAIEPHLMLFSRTNNSVLSWNNIGAAQDINANTLTVAGQSTEYILGSFGFALPVTLFSLKAQKINITTVELSWQTATELNNRGFEVQRSFDGSNFTDVKFVIGAGNSTSIISYNTTDIPGRTGRVYYRLKQLDLDGNSKLSNIVSVLFSTGDIVKIYSNPAQQQVIIEGATTYNRIQVLDETGRLLRDIGNNRQYQVTLNLDGLNNGFYFIRLMNEKETQTIKLTISN